MKVALVNTNRIKPPVAPIGLDYIAEALAQAGHSPEILDLCFAADSGEAISRFFRENEFGLVGLTLRNTDDCSFTSGDSFLGEFAIDVEMVRNATDAPLVIGGVGFSTFPGAALTPGGPEVGIWGEGEFLFPEIANRIAKKRSWFDLPSLVRLVDGRPCRTPPYETDLRVLPRMTRRFVDNSRYFKEGGQAGIETKRGCPGKCIYCADPVAKGNRVRLRPPRAVVDEMTFLLDQGIDSLHLCDSEFNIPPGHASAICREITRRGLGEKVRWFAYCSPVPFSRELASQMARAGCRGINFGVDSGDPEMLISLRRSHAAEDILSSVAFCRETKIPVMLDLLLGSPGESEASITKTIELMKRAEPDCVGVAAGVRVYPGTELSKMVDHGHLANGLSGGNDPQNPIFFMEPAVADTIFPLLNRLIGDDERFFFFDPDRPRQNYNYNANQLLVEAIARGYRGAYWDILRRYNPPGVP